MTVRSPFPRFGRRFGWLLLVVALLAIRSVSPEGWMPVAGESGGVEITVCNGQGPGDAMVLSNDGTLKHKAPAKGQAGDHPCVFAGIGVASAPPAVALPVPVRAAAEAAPAARAETIPGRGLAAPPPPATGPPALA